MARPGPARHHDPCYCLYDLPAPKRPGAWNYRFVHGIGQWSPGVGKIESVRLEVCQDGEPKKYPVDVPLEEATEVAKVYAEFTAMALQNRGRRWNFRRSG